MDNVNQNTDQKKRERSSPYPAFSLGEAIEAVTEVSVKLGRSFCSRESIAQAMGYSGVTGSSATKISACVQFGLLDKSNGTYALSELAERIVTPTSEAEKKKATIEAASAPSLYSKLLEAYDGRPLPQMLDNILVRQYGLTTTAAKKAVFIFKKSLEYAGCLRNGVVQTNQYQPQSIPEQPAQAAVSNQYPENPATRDQQNDVNGYTTVEIPGTDVKILFPSRYTYNLTLGNFSASIKKLKEELDSVDEENS